MRERRLPPPSCRGEDGASAVGTATVYGLAAVVFVLDVVTHLGLAVGLLYVPLVLVAYFMAPLRHVAVIAAVAAALAVLGAVLSPPSATVLSPEDVVANRAMAVLGIAACGWFGVAMLRQRRRLERSNRSLHDARNRVEHQTGLLRIAGEVGRFGGWSVDVPADRVHWSGEAARIHGGDTDWAPSLEEVIDLYVPEDQARFREAFGRCVRRGEPFDLELQLHGRDGVVRWVNAVGRASRHDPVGQVLRVDGALQDVTDRITAQLDAAEHRRTVDMLGDSMPFIIWTADPDGELDYLSAELWRYSGVLTQDALGEAWIALVHPDDRDRVLDDWARSLASGSDYTTHMRLRRRDGRYRWHLVRAVPERDAGGAVTKWWGSSTEVHELRELESRATALARRLEDTLESIGDAVLALDPQGRVTFVNSHAERLLQHDRAELSGRLIWDVFPHARGSAFQQQYEQVMAEGRAARFDAPFEPLGLHAEVTAYPHEHGLTIYFRDTGQQAATHGEVPPGAL